MQKKKIVFTCMLFLLIKKKVVLLDIELPKNRENSFVVFKTKGYYSSS
jgi:hypothetical protein